jgi:two-component system cell cycle sensor histidine kinase/response regulator CckA
VTDPRYMPRALLDGLDAIVWEMDPVSWQFTFVSAAAERILGYPGEQWISERDFWQNHIHPDDRDRAVSYCGACVADGCDHEIEYRMVASDGRSVWLRDMVHVVPPSGSSNGELHGVMFDISSQKLRETELRENAERLRLLLQQVPALVWTTDRHLNLTSVMGMGSTAFDAGSARDTVQETVSGTLDAPIVVAAHEAALEGRPGSYSIDWNGARLQATVEPLRDAAGGILGVVAIAMDVTEKHRASSALADSEERYRELVQRMADGVVVHVNGEIVFVNQAAIALVGAESREQLLGRSVVDFIHPDEVQRGIAQLRALSSARAPQPFSEFRMLRPDGTVRNVEFSATTVQFGLTGAVQIVCRDVTERIRAAEALRDKDLQLQQSQKLEAVGRLAGGVAHDFNNLLTVITGFTQIVLEQIASDDARHGDLREVQRAAHAAAKLTRQLLAFSRKQLLQPAELDLNVIVAEAEKMLARVIGEDLHLVTRYAQGGAPVLADRGQLEQVLMNLVVNARDAMPHGGVLTVVTDIVTLDDPSLLKRLDLAAGRYVRLQVVDTGVGMPPEVAAFIFEPFFTTKPPTTGTGLGLSMVYGIVKQSGGAIDLSTEPGKGATFSLYFPEAGGPEVEEHISEPVALGHGETILLVEDSDAVRMVARRILTASGYRVLSAEGGNEALAIAQTEGGAIDLLLTDVVMPGLNGREVAERLRERTPSLRVLFMSGYTEDEVVRRGVASGGSLLQKPFTMDGLTAAVRAVLDQPAA